MTAIPQESLLGPELRRRARDAVRGFGERLLIESRDREMPDPGGERVPTRAFNGSPGFALTYLALATATGDQRYEQAMHEHFRLAAHTVDRPHTGLYSGMSGLRAVAQIATVREPRYAGLVAQCDAFIDSELPTQPTQPERYSTYDLIAGWSGVRLAKCVDGPREPDRLIDFLAWLLEDDARWRCVHPVIDNGPENDLGLAHGIAGVLAAFGLTLHEIPRDYRERVRAAAHALAAAAVVSDGLYAWPSSAQKCMPGQYRAAWCYGAPGICAALTAVATTLRDDELARFAADALVSVARRSAKEWVVGEAGICHGMMGNALCFASVGVARENDALLEAAQAAVVSSLDVLEAAGGSCLTASDGSMVDSIGVLTGLCGIVLGLLTLSGEFDGAWMRCHGLPALR